jgi:hypothetical protein
MRSQRAARRLGHGLAVSSALIGGRLLSRGAQFNPSEDFDWLAILGTYPNAMIVSSRSNHTTLEQWLAAGEIGEDAARVRIFRARLRRGPSRPGRTCASSTVPTSPTRRCLLSTTAYAMLNEGRLDVLFDGVPNAVVKIPRSGHRIVAVTSAARVPQLPDVPAFGELWQQSFRRLDRSRSAKGRAAFRIRKARHGDQRSPERASLRGQHARGGPLVHGDFRDRARARSSRRSSCAARSSSRA